MARGTHPPPCTRPGLVCATAVGPGSGRAEGPPRARLRMFAAENSRQRSPPRSPDTAISAGTPCATCMLVPLRPSGWRREAVRSPAWFDDASRRDPGQLVGLPIFGGERVAIRAGWPALDVPLAVPGAAGGRLPRLILGHRPFDREEAPIVVGDDQEERSGLARVGHGALTGHLVNSPVRISPVGRSSVTR